MSTSRDETGAWWVTTYQCPSCELPLLDALEQCPQCYVTSVRVDKKIPAGSAYHTHPQAFSNDPAGTPPSQGAA